MTKSLFKSIIFIILIVLVPLSASAWSWQDLFSQESNAQENEEIEVSNLEKKEIKKKYQAWQEACSKDDINALVNNKENLRFSQEEANLIAEMMLDNSKDPMLTNPEIDFRPGMISLSGYLLKPITGEVYLEVIVYPSADKLEFDVLKARYRGFYFPPFLANRILRKPLNKFFTTLYSHNDYYTIEPVVKEEELIIKYH